MADAPLLQRLAALLKPRSRLADCEAMLSEAESALEAARAAKAAAEERRLDPALSDDQAAEAQLDAEEQALVIARLERGLAKLRDAIRVKKNEGKEAARRALYAEVTERHAALVAELRDRVPGIYAELAALNARIEAVDAEAGALNAKPPRGLPQIDPVEAVARKLPRNFYIGAAPILRLTQVRLPSFYPTERRDPIWPDELAARIDRNERERKAAREARQARRQREAAERARWAWYDLSHKLGRGVTVDTRGGPALVLKSEGRTVEMDADQVAAARAEGVKVTPARLATYRVGRPNRRGLFRRELATASGTVPAPTGEPFEYVMTDAQAEAARGLGFEVEQLAEAEAAE